MQERSPEQLIELGKRELAESHRNHAYSLFRKALEEGERSLDPKAKADLLKAIGRLDRSFGRLEDARVHYAMSAEITRMLNSPLALAHTLRHVADILLEQKKLSEAEPIYAEVLAIYRADPGTQPLDLANALRGNALLMEALKRQPEALASWSEAKSLYEHAAVHEGVAESSRRMEALVRAG
jgi:tetratricopeptide (TPR) repeat protein